MGFKTETSEPNMTNGSSQNRVIRRLEKHKSEKMKLEFISLKKRSLTCIKVFTF